MNMIHEIYRSVVSAAQSLRRKYVSLKNTHIKVSRELKSVKDYSDAIIEVIPGQKFHRGENYALFVFFEPDGNISGSVRRIMEALKKAKVEVVVLCNHVLSEGQNSYFASNAHTIILRDNTGFDFGAYKDGIRYLFENKIEPSRLIILNDSVFFRKRGLDEMVKSLLADDDAIGTFENWGEEHHIQSFCFSVSNYVFRSDSFREFWNDYKPINDRIYAIKNGEKGLSKAVLSAARSTSIIYSTGKLADALSSKDYSDIRLVLLPIQWRHIIENMSPERNVQFVHNKLLDIVNCTSPIHAGAYLFPANLNCPIFKKDIVYRNRFQFWEVESWLGEVMLETEKNEFLTLLRKKSDRTKLSSSEKILYDVGVK